MTITLNKLSENELAALLDNAQKMLVDKQKAKRKETIQKIKELADSIDVTVRIIESDNPGGSRAGYRAAIKFRNPENSAEKWSGRGVYPKWLRSLLEQGRSLDEFRV